MGKEELKKRALGLQLEESAAQGATTSRARMSLRSMSYEEAAAALAPPDSSAQRPAQVTQAQKSKIDKMKELEGKEAAKETAKLGGPTVQSALPGHDSVSLHAPAQTSASTKAAIQSGVDLVAGQGFELPEVAMRMGHDNGPGKENVRSLAMMQSGGREDYQMFLSPTKLVAHSAMLGGTDRMIEGGTRDAKATGANMITSGARGVADQEGDKARTNKSWFNKKKKNDALSNAAYAKAVVVHEFGHILHAQRSPEAFWDQKTNPAKYQNGDLIALAAEVSEYATQNSLEFVAEVFTGVTLGFEYSEAVMAKYKELGGPSATREHEQAPGLSLDDVQRAHTPEPLTGRGSSHI